ncbi:hypothetical protein POM88_034998 [Heracleum sosnowskyi]|uniref:Uncharacterized protein n=1 Tax=Heracleum sosnowskyi TaxID=360622 RepID=A0AAD8HLM0_9APIA|nr:hypothetical protein POM88_034998 [Heracleum sosnowskyi]
MSETKLTNEVIEPMTKDGADNEASSEAKPVTTTEAPKPEEPKPEEVAGLICCACCVACATFVACLPCYIASVVVKCLFLPCKCVTVFCCPPEEKVPVPASTASA